MAGRAVIERWLAEMTHLPTASGLEHRVADWIRRWVARRPDLTIRADSGGNLLITQKGRKPRPPVLAVAHMDHPAFVATGGDGFVFRGGVDPVYFDDARIEVVTTRVRWRYRVETYDEGSQTGTMTALGEAPELKPDEILMWAFPKTKKASGMFQAPACDDLAGLAASLAALDGARRRTNLPHFGVLCTRAEEVGLIGAIHSAKFGTIPPGSRVISIETSRELPTAPLGGGPIIRTGDRATVFDRDMTNRISQSAARAGLAHQRKLMDGGGCEATAFGAYGYQAAGLCVALRNWHNRGNLDEVEAGTGEAVAMLEEISLDDFHGLVALIGLAASAVDKTEDMVGRLDRLYDTERHLLDT